MEEDIKLVEQRLDYYEESPEGCNWRVSFEGNEITQLRNLLTRYKQLDSLIGEIDNKEVNDALHMLLHCALKNTEYETQKQQFQIVNAYIKQLEEENKELLEVKISASAHNRIMELEEENKQLEAIKDEAIRKYNFESIPVSKVKGIIEQLDERIKNPERTSYWASYTISECIGIRRILQDILGEE